MHDSDRETVRFRQNTNEKVVAHAMLQVKSGSPLSRYRAAPDDAVISESLDYDIKV